MSKLTLCIFSDKCQKGQVRNKSPVWTTSDKQERLCNNWPKKIISFLWKKNQRQIFADDGQNRNKEKLNGNKSQGKKEKINWHQQKMEPTSSFRDLLLLEATNSMMSRLKRCLVLLYITNKALGWLEADNYWNLIAPLLKILEILWANKNYRD